MRESLRRTQFCLCSRAAFVVGRSIASRGAAVTYQDILCDKRDGVAKTAISRPPGLNAFRAQTVGERLAAVADAAEASNTDSEKIRAIGSSSFEALAHCYRTEEAQEGARAFLEKPRPNFRRRK